MREGIHPEYNAVTISCACGATLKLAAQRLTILMFVQPAILTTPEKHDC